MLPPELLTQVLLCLDPGDPVSTKALCRFACCCRLFAEVVESNDKTIWRAHVLSRYARGRLEPSLGSWRELLKKRTALDREADEAIETLTRSTRARDPVFDHVRLDGGMNVLERVTGTKTLEKSILRDEAIRKWRTMAEHDYLQAAAAFCDFRGEDSVDASTGIRALAGSVHERPDDRELVPNIVALMQARGYGSAPSDHFHDIDNHFITAVDRGETHGTLPMTMVIVFCSICASLPKEWQIEARAISFPGVMLASFRRGSGPTHFVNVFENGKVLDADGLRRMAFSMGVEWTDDFLEPASTRSVAFRIAQNILTSIRSQNVASKTRTDCLYAAATACVLCARPGVNTTIYTSWLCSLIESAYPEDASLLVTLRPEGMQGRIDTRLLHDDIVEEASREPTPKRRPPDGTIRFPIGKVFRHRLFGYWAVTTGYDERCEAGEQWIMQMQVDRLPLGRSQPFYNVFSEDDSQRYVAQENIPPWSSSRFAGDAERHVALLVANEELGRYFYRTTHVAAGDGDPGGGVHFVPNARMAHEFPDDDIM